MWTAFVDLVRATLFAGSHLLNGSLGASVILVTAVVRVALIPLAIRAARHARAQQALLARIKPELERLKRRHGADQLVVARETQALYRTHGVQMMGRDSLISTVLQLPLIGGLFSALRGGFAARTGFLWIRDLSLPDPLLALGATALAGIAVSTAGAPDSPMGPKVIAAIVMGTTLMFLWSASSAIALSVGAGSAVSLVQNALIARDARRQPPA